MVFLWLILQTTLSKFFGKAAYKFSITIYICDYMCVCMYKHMHTHTYTFIDTELLPLLTFEMVEFVEIREMLIKRDGEIAVTAA